MSSILHPNSHSGSRDRDEQDEKDSIVVSFINVKESSKKPQISIPRRVMRRRFTVIERQLIWRSAQERCYLCKMHLPMLSSWHIEHVVAFSDDPIKNDVLGNVLPACASCNLRKYNKSLKHFVESDLTLDLSTECQGARLLNTCARFAICEALQIKHDRQAVQNLLDTKHKVLSEMDSQVLSDILKAIEMQLSKKGTSDSTSSASDDVELKECRIERSEINFDAKIHRYFDYISTELILFLCIHTTTNFSQSLYSPYYIKGGRVW
jgi:hypothetical protein